MKKQEAAMRIGVAAQTVEAIVAAEQAGFPTSYTGMTLGLDSLTLLAAAGQRTKRIEMITTVVPTYPRHPVALAQQALTVQSLSGNRLVLGIGPSHPYFIEQQFGLDSSTPIGHMRDYLTVLGGVLGGEPFTYSGSHFRVATQLNVPGAVRPSIIVSALGPQMLRLAGELSDGTVTWFGSAAYHREFVVPHITEAAHRVGRPTPRVIAGVMVCVTEDREGAREVVNQVMGLHAQMPAYKAQFIRSGVEGPADVALIGTEEQVGEQLEAYREAGVSDIAARPFGSPGQGTERTTSFLTLLAKQRVAAV